MIGGNERAKVITVNHPHISHFMMVGTKRYCVFARILAALALWCNVMYLYDKIEAAHYTATPITFARLIASVRLFAALPQRVSFSIKIPGMAPIGALAATIAICFTLQHTGPSLEIFSAMIANYLNFIYTPLPRLRPLPCSVAGIIATGNTAVRFVRVKGIHTNGATVSNWPAAIIAVVLPPVLMVSDIPVLPTRGFRFGHILATTTSAQNAR